MNVKINHLEEVWTADGRRLGLAKFLHHRLDSVDPELEYYAAYLEVENLEYGTEYYVPTDFIAGRATPGGRLELTTTLKQVMDNTWSRRPEFVLHGASRSERLPKE
jgi:hypothetical protein